MNTTQEYQTNHAIQALMTALDSPFSADRDRARRTLVQMGAVSVPALIQATTSPSVHKRWQAARALGESGDLRGIAALVRAFEDEDAGVRWRAMESLADFDRRSLPVLLEELEKHAGSVLFRRGANYVFHTLAKRGLLKAEEKKVVQALGDVAPDVEVPWAAEAALKALKENR